MSKYSFGVEEDMVKLEESFASAATVEDGVKALQGLIELTDIFRPDTCQLTPLEKLEDELDSIALSNPAPLNEIQQQSVETLRGQLSAAPAPGL